MKDPQEIDRWLDEALTHYASAEPRPGLENRTLARLASETRAPGNIHWWAFALGTAALAVLLLLWLRPALQTVPPPDVRWTAEVRPPMALTLATSSSAGAGRLEQPRSVATARYQGGVQPKRERFPSPSPLTQQEKMLARFVRDFPQKAAVVAQLQTELYQQDQKEMASPWPPKEDH